MSRRLRPVVQAQHGLDDVFQFRRDLHESVAPAISAALMFVLMQLDRERLAELRHAPR